MDRFPRLACIAATLWLGTSLATVLAADRPDEKSAYEEPRIRAADRDHWSFQPPRRVDPPAVKDNAWPRNAIDHFILAKLESRNLRPMREADRDTLIRRVTFDLTGLPPTPDEIDAFLNDESNDAWEKLVDRLLASRAYGQRLAQHWLDLASYAETDGFEHDKIRAEAWRYRDWVIQALNDDMPYDEFVRMQLAGDEIRKGPGARDEGPGEDNDPRDDSDSPTPAPKPQPPSPRPHPPDLSIATGFLLAGPDMPDVNDQDERRHIKLNQITSTVAAVFLGLTFECAQCHDHKFDPISQADFYRLRAVFESAIPQLRRDKPIGTVIDENNPKTAAAYIYARGDHRKPVAEVPAAFPRVLSDENDNIPAAPKDATSTGRRVALADWLTQPDHPLTTRVIVNRLWQHHFGRGLVASSSDFGFMGDDPTHPELLDFLATELPRRDWSLKAMHKLMVTSATYRTASKPSVSIPVHGGGPGRGSAATARTNTGSSNAGSPPPQPSPIKGEGRTPGESWSALLEKDPRNHLLGRMNGRRLEGEALRDAMLAVAGRLSDRAGGPGVMAPLPDEVAATLLNNQWKVADDEQDHRRRSVYLFVRRNLRFPIFEAFDRPDANASCAHRARSTTAPQALFVLNSEFSLEMARQLAGHVMRHAAHDSRDRIFNAYRRVLGRVPTDSELKLGQDFLIDQTTRLSNEARPADKLALPPGADTGIDRYAAAALTDLCLALLNLNEFLYVD